MIVVMLRELGKGFYIYIYNNLPNKRTTAAARVQASCVIVGNVLSLSLLKVFRDGGK